MKRAEGFCFLLSASRCFIKSIKIKNFRFFYPKWEQEFLKAGTHVPDFPHNFPKSAQSLGFWVQTAKKKWAFLLPFCLFLCKTLFLCLFFCLFGVFLCANCLPLQFCPCRQNSRESLVTPYWFFCFWKLTQKTDNEWNESRQKKLY